MITVLAPLLAKLFAVLAAGVLLRPRVSARAHALVNRLIIDVVMPALLLLALWRTSFEPTAVWAVLPAAAAHIVICMLAWLTARAFHLPRTAQGSALLTTTFANTGFLGYPVVLALFGSDGAAASTAITIDTLCTTVGLWTVGAVLAARHGGRRPYSLGGLLRALVRPLTVCVATGLALSLVNVPAPSFTDTLVTWLGVTVSVLVFLSLGLALDATTLRARLPPIAALGALKLIVMPLLALVAARLMHLPPVVTGVAVLQCAMPSAMVSVIVSIDEGCDRDMAAGVAALTTLACVLTLPLVAWLIEVSG
ncbi:MAG: AEC family transporter [Deltaproteobacteria bacterium]|nr:AEC family transporter [Deltaproteobacteria bacterium]